MPFVMPPPEWTAGTVTALGDGLALTGGTLDATGAGASEWNAGTVTALGDGLALTGGTLDATGAGASEWNAGTVTALGGGLALTGGTLDATGGSSAWTATPVSALDPSLAVTTGTLAVTGLPAVTRPAATAFGTWHNQAGATLTDVSGGPIVLEQATAQTGDQWTFVTKSLVTGAFTLNVLWDLSLLPAATGLVLPGIIVYNNTNSRFTTFGLQSVAQFVITRWTAPSTFGATPVSVNLRPDRRIFTRIDYDGSNTLTYSVSFDSVKYWTIGTESVSAWLLSMTDIGFGCDFKNNPAGQHSAMLIYQWVGA